MTTCSADLDLDPRKLAAVVYDDRVSIDALMTMFASNLSAAGARVAGVLQLPPTDGGCGPGSPMCLWDVTTGEAFAMCQVDGAEPASCHLDLDRFERMSDRLLAACETNADLVFVSRFGKMEARGGGFRDAIAKAAQRRRPVLTAVRRGLVPSWFAFTGDVGTVLDARYWVLQDWWREIGREHR